MKRGLLITLAALLFAATPGAHAQITATAKPGVSEREAQEIARAGYVYAYPLVIMELTRRALTNVSAPQEDGKAPVNQFGHMTEFPDASFTDVVRPNADTLYSMMFYDVTKEPLVISVPDSGGRYFLLQILDMWTDVFSSRGARTTGTGAQTFAIVGPAWQGRLPNNVDLVRSPTGSGWIIGRTQTDGKGDYAAVRKFQAGLKNAPLSQWGRVVVRAPVQVAVSLASAPPPPVDQVARMDGVTFFTLFSQLMAANPPHLNDGPMIDRLRRIDITPGAQLDWGKVSPETQRALNEAPAAALPRIHEQFRKVGTMTNGWRTNYTAIGTYGADYLARAAVAYAALGANTIEDAMYPTAIADGAGQPFSSDQNYVMRFTKNEIPPVRAFWSLTMYNDRQVFVDNPIDRYAIGDRDKLKYNPDGSLDIYIQRASPGADKEANWLPAPPSGPFTMNLRLYWPKQEALDGTWTPPGVTRLN